MEYMISACTDIGIQKVTNQDSLMVRTAQTPMGKIAFAAMCDGMGGLEKGEVASASLIQALEEWFDGQLPYLVSEPIQDHVLRSQWERILREQNDKIRQYGKRNGFHLGTTVVLMLLTQERYYIMNVGDSRAYEIFDYVNQITEDQTMVAKEVREGLLTPEEALHDDRRSILLQCIGASDQVFPDMYFGETKQNAVYMLCSDGFVHEITNEEIYQYLRPEIQNSKDDLRNHIQYLIEQDKQRAEQDNISVAAVRTW